MIPRQARDAALRLAPPFGSLRASLAQGCALRRAQGVALVVALASSGAWALTGADVTQTGTPGLRGTFLLRGVGARPAGMGEAYTAVADDASAGAWNPGGLAKLDGPAAVVMYDALGEDLGSRYLAGAVPLGPGVAGAGLTAMSYGSYDILDAQGNRTGSDALVDASLSLAYAFREPARLNACSGAMVEMVRDSVGGVFTAFGAGTEIPVGGRWVVGAAVQHLGPKRGLAQLPSLARAGAGVSLPWGLTAAADVVRGLVDGETWLAGGVEAAVHPQLFLRAGYKRALEGPAISGLTGVTAGLGARLSGVEVDYAYQPLGYLATSHRFSVSWRGAR